MRHAKTEKCHVALCDEKEKRNKSAKNWPFLTIMVRIVLQRVDFAHDAKGLNLTDAHILEIIGGYGGHDAPA